MTKVFIDGSSGTTGLRIRERLAERSELELVPIDYDARHEPEARREAMKKADIVFLCLPDDAARESALLAKDLTCKVIDTSTAHRTSPDWVYGFPEIGFREAIKSSRFIANPGCHATGFISAVAPLRALGILDGGAHLTAFSLTGYSGGGKKMIADYEGDARSPFLKSAGIYGLGQHHKHLPEIAKYCSLDTPPVFCPVVDDYYSGMATCVMLDESLLHGIASKDDLKKALAEFYEKSPVVSVAEDETLSTVYGNTLSGKDTLTLIVSGGDGRYTVTSLFDNLGKGASGAAIQNMNLALGVDETAGLSI